VPAEKKVVASVIAARNLNHIEVLRDDRLSMEEKKSLETRCRHPSLPVELW